MTDELVVRLNGLAVTALKYPLDAVTVGLIVEAMKEAASLIERQTSALADAARELAEANTRLGIYADNLAKNGDTFKQLQARLSRLEASNASLRGALPKQDRTI